MQDRNKKDLEVGDEVVVQFRVTGFAEPDFVILETVHNREKVMAVAGAVLEEVTPMVLSMQTFRTILTRKFKKA